MKNMKKSLKNKEKTQKKRKKYDIFKKISIFFNKLIFPDDIKCVFCGRDIPSFYEKPYCSNCEKLLPKNDGKRCLICDEPIGNEAVICDHCQKNKRYFKKARAPFLYKDLVRKSLLSYKSDNKRYLAKGYAIIIAKEIKGWKIDLITYVPMTKRKEKERSFNQSKLLAKNLAKILNLPCFETLEKVSETKSQKTLNYLERQKNLLSVFNLKDKELVKNKNVLIVDDIITTCATLNTCAKILSKHANNIFVCALARNALKKEENENVEL